MEFFLKLEHEQVPHAPRGRVKCDESSDTPRACSPADKFLRRGWETVSHGLATDGECIFLCGLTGIVQHDIM